MPAEIGRDLDKAAKLLSEGQVVGIPTETVYGLAANAFNEKAVASIFEVKNRPFFDPLIVHCKSYEFARKLSTGIPEKARLLAEHFWPGPITLVLPKSSSIPDIVTSGNPTVALRVPSHPLTLELLSKLDFPLAAPSANPFGYISPTSAKHVADQLGDKIRYIIDGGASSVGLESTIVAVDENGSVNILRLGGLSIERIEAIAGKVNLRISSHSDPQAPGQLDSHYAPRVPLRFGDLDNLLSEIKSTDKTGVITFSRNVPGLAPGNLRILSPKGDLNEAACNLFRAMRELDGLGLELILAEKMPEQGLGHAINDRLKRACEK